MEITLVIVGGVIVITLIGVVGDLLGKSVKSRSGADPKALRDLSRRVEDLERLSLDREERIRRLEADVAFANKLLEDRSGKA
ncbi:MAG TPA: hypothetical protein P5117_03440 [Spirochaetia bacterium]|nr:hypothetical protein [Spirochaetales bacterium]HRY79807.1 hypothetical protein [Spirochaetia bacterium]HRZ88518.1 hypothetical protein [Spirochaetia bacterium]